MEWQPTYEDDDVEFNVSNETAWIELKYPLLNKIKFVEIDQMSVRASDGIRVTYDYDRDGWSIQQPKRLIGDIGASHVDYKWTEVYFAQSWAINEDPEE